MSQLKTFIKHQGARCTHKTSANARSARTRSRGCPASERPSPARRLFGSRATLSSEPKSARRGVAWRRQQNRAAHQNRRKKKTQHKKKDNETFSARCKSYRVEKTGLGRVERRYGVAERLGAKRLVVVGVRILEALGDFGNAVVRTHIVRHQRLGMRCRLFLT